MKTKTYDTNLFLTLYGSSKQSEWEIRVTFTDYGDEIAVNRVETWKGKSAGWVDVTEALRGPMLDEITRHIELECICPECEAM